jgi:hypothetical protein
MLEKIPDVPEGIDALEAVGKLTKEDDERTVESVLDEARRRGRRIRRGERPRPGCDLLQVRLFDGYGDRERRRVDPGVVAPGRVPAAVSAAGGRQ